MTPRNHVKKEVVFLIPYFGKLPSYFDVFIESIANKNFDLIFFSGSPSPNKLPSNVKWHVSSLEEIKKLITKKSGQPVSINLPYKLCDFRPAFGLIFQTYISAYTFWGSIDVDVCMGNFDKFLDSDFFEKIDVFSGIKEYVSGSFFLVRNNPHCNSLFKKSKDWKTVFNTEKYLGFDECGGRFFKELKAGKTFEEIQPAIESFTEVLFKEPQGKTRLVFENVVAEPEWGITRAAKGKIMYDNKEYLLVHYVSYKSAQTFYTNKKIDLPIYINRFGFFKNRPGLFILLFSKNFRIAVINKIRREIKKLKAGV